MEVRECFLKGVLQVQELLRLPTQPDGATLAMLKVGHLIQCNLQHETLYCKTVIALNVKDPSVKLMTGYKCSEAQSPNARRISISCYCLSKACSRALQKLIGKHDLHYTIRVAG